MGGRSRRLHQSQASPGSSRRFRLRGRFGLPSPSRRAMPSPLADEGAWALTGVVAFKLGTPAVLVRRTPKTDFVSYGDDPRAGDGWLAGEKLPAGTPIHLVDDLGSPVTRCARPGRLSTWSVSTPGPPRPSSGPIVRTSEGPAGGGRPHRDHQPGPPEPDPGLQAHRPPPPRRPQKPRPGVNHHLAQPWARSTGQRIDDLGGSRDFVIYAGDVDDRPSDDGATAVGSTAARQRPVLAGDRPAGRLLP